MINDIIFSLNKDKMLLFKKLIEKDIGVEELRVMIGRYVTETHQNKSKIIDDFMVKYDCSVDNFEAPKCTEKDLDNILQEYFLVKHISTFFKKGHIPPTSKS